MISKYYPIEDLLDFPHQQVARNAYCIVMNYPHHGKLKKEHLIAIKCIEVGIVGVPIGLKIDKIFMAKFNDLINKEII